MFGQIHYLQFNNIAQPEVTNDVRIVNLVLINDTNVQFSWDPPSLLPFVDPNLYQVNFRLHVLRNESQEYELFGDLATNHSNCGEATLSLPQELTSSTDVFSFLVELSIAGPISEFLRRTCEIIKEYIRRRISRWTSPAIAFLRSQFTLCRLWCLNEPQDIGDKLLRSVRPCPLTAQRARLPNSGFREDAGRLRRTLNWIFHRGADTCFRQVVFDE